ncbi:MAG: AbgT family transporter [Thermoanaerobaculum sp.]|nr:AbgT family transporter [Thermoanaerobaculum sp.]
MGQGKNGVLVKLLNWVERVGNALPHPATLFLLLALLTALFSSFAKAVGFQAIHPTTGEVVVPRSLLSSEGIRWAFEHVDDNFVRFPPLGLVLVAMIGIGLAEGSGLLTVLIRAVVLGAPRRLMTGALVLAGVLSHVASEAGYVILIPLGAATFAALGRHPLAGLAAAFAGVSGGFGANLVIASVDPVLAGLSESAAHILDPSLRLSPAINLYFGVASTVVIVLVGTWVTERLVVPRLGSYGDSAAPAVEPLSPQERKALLSAGAAAVVLCLFFVLSLAWPGALLRVPEQGVLQSAFFRGLITAVMLFFFVPGLVYGWVVGTIRTDKDVLRFLTDGMKHMAGYIVLVFFAAQFVAFFGYSNVGVILAIRGAELLKSVSLTGIPLLVAFVLLSATINLFMGSASAKWAIMAPVFVPMFMLLGYHPAVTQAAFRIGDSVTNVVTPMMSYFALIVTFVERYVPRAGIGTLISLMLPYSLIFTVAWTLFLVLWVLLGIPVGPDGPLHYTLPARP